MVTIKGLLWQKSHVAVSNFRSLTLAWILYCKFFNFLIALAHNFETFFLASNFFHNYIAEWMNVVRAHLVPLHLLLFGIENELLLLKQKLWEGDLTYF